MAQVLSPGETVVVAKVFMVYRIQQQQQQLFIVL